jgi:signal recognition particle subunit SRP54
MVPGLKGALPQVDDDATARRFRRMEAMVRSMTSQERNHAEILNGSRRLRIAKGSGTSVTEVNQLLKQFDQAKKMMNKMQQKGRSGAHRGGMPGLG